MKKKAIIIGTLLLIMAAIILFAIYFNISKTRDENSSKTSNETEFPSITVETMKQAIHDQGDMVIYYGQDTCGSCIAFKPMVIEASKLLKIKVYYLDYDKVIDSAFLENYGINLTPTLIVIRNGNLTKYEGNFDIETTKLIMRGSLETTKERLNNITPISYEELTKKMSGNVDFLLYIGRPDCQDCQSFSPILEEYVNSHKNSGVYYLNIKEFRDKTLDGNAQSKDMQFYN